MNSLPSIPSSSDNSCGVQKPYGQKKAIDKIMENSLNRQSIPSLVCLSVDSAWLAPPLSSSPPLLSPPLLSSPLLSSPLLKCMQLHNTVHVILPLRLDS